LLFDSTGREKQRRMIEQLWVALATDPDRVIRQALETELHYMATFLDTAREQGHVDLARWVWRSLADQPTKLAEQTWKTPIGHISGFFRIATDHRQLLESVAQEKQTQMINQLWAALRDDPQQLAEQVFKEKLGHLAPFFETCVAHGQAELLKGLWASLAAQLERLAEQAARTPLDQVAVFLEMCHAQGQVELFKRLWALLAAQLERSPEQTARTPLQQVAVFVVKAEEQAALLDEPGQEKQTQMIDHLWAFFLKEPKRLAEGVQEMNSSNLSYFLNKAPDTVGRCAVASIKCGTWAFNASCSLLLVGGASLAVCFGELGRADLQRALIDNLLRRANWKDFSGTGSGLYEVAVLLAHVPDTAREAVPTFMDALCTPKWLGWQYTNANCGVLAAALRLLAFHDAPAMLRRFRNYCLGVRLKKELMWFAARQLRERHQVIQLLGTAYLLGAPGDRQWFAKLPLAEVARLPTEALPHGPEAIKVEDWQLHLWLGLRIIATQAYSPLVVDKTTLARTLELWRTNLAETSPNPKSTAHRVNQSMVEWLERCASHGKGLLLPNHEPLWALAGLRVSGA
jgi:hypothetical protein